MERKYVVDYVIKTKRKFASDFVILSKTPKPNLKLVARQHNIGCTSTQQTPKVGSAKSPSGFVFWRRKHIQKLRKMTQKRPAKKYHSVPESNYKRTSLEYRRNLS